MSSKLDFHYIPSKNFDRIPLTDHSAEHFHDSTSKSEENVDDHSLPNVEMKFIEDTPYMSDKTSLGYMVKDDQLDISDHTADSFSFFENSEFTLTDNIRIRQTRSRTNV